MIAPDPGCLLQIADVTIGKGFHWQQEMTQCFEGSLRLLKRDSTLLLINDIPLEAYLTSVISSEMNANAPVEFLKAHAIISRSWLLAQLNKRHEGVSRTEDDHEITVWYDRDDHDLFDVCADDHCQRYQGVTGRNQAVIDAVDATRGQVVTYNDTICDTRFSKCCGGIVEEFQNCWEPSPKPYLVALRDDAVGGLLPDMGDEKQVAEFITRGDYADFCAHAPREALAAVLNDYDLATRDFYRWSDTITAGELASRVEARTGRDLGYITELRALHRGPSGRITRLLIKGRCDSLIVGKELEIRRVLSRSHLYSSAFIDTIVGEGAEAEVILHGAGWGHGVGLCQIGAATMALEGYTATQILNHYFPNTIIKTDYGTKN